MNRRDFVKTVGGMSVAALATQNARAEEAAAPKEFVGVLVDTTLCVGCRSCEFACAKVHGFPEPDPSPDVFKEPRQTSTKQWSVVNRFETDKGEMFVKKQCMHCNQPACAAACATKAMLKTEDGPVIWRADKCMGCRFCMLSCPFDVPKFEYDSWIPKIQKCNLCWDRLQEGEKPACVEACPVEAIKFGERRELIEMARARIAKNPDTYVQEIYGEHDAGGTGYLYLASVPFEQLGFRTDLGTIAYPEYTKDFLYAVPVILTLWPAFLLAVSNATRKDND
jgi:formate dehydrogenase iron-sulfur subunit